MSGARRLVAGSCPCTFRAAVPGDRFGVLGFPAALHKCTHHPQCRVVSGRVAWRVRLPSTSYALQGPDAQHGGVHKHGGSPAVGTECVSGAEALCRNTYAHRRGRKVYACRVAVERPVASDPGCLATAVGLLPLTRSGRARLRWTLTSSCGHSARLADRLPARKP